MWYYDTMEKISDKGSEGLVLKSYFWNFVPNMDKLLTYSGIWFLFLSNNNYSIYPEGIFLRITIESLNFKTEILAIL